MRGLVKAVLLVAACILSTGFARVVHVDGKVTGRAGLDSEPRQLKVDDYPVPLSRVVVGTDASVTLREGECEIEFTKSFIVPADFKTLCDRKRDDDEDKNEQQQSGSQDDAGGDSGSTSAGTDSGSGTTGGLSGLQKALIATASTLTATEAYQRTHGKSVSP